MMTTWTTWSPCSVQCGKGHTIRVREYAKKELESQCTSQLIEKKSCVVNEKCLDESLMSSTERKSKMNCLNKIEVELYNLK